MQRTETTGRGFSPIFDELRAIPGFGGQWDWSRVSDDFFQSGKFTVKLNGAVAVGADSLTVDALTKALKQGDILKSADVPTVLVTVNDADVNAAETGITVVALPGPLPAGAILQFSGAGGGYAKLTAAAAAGATALVVEALPEDIDNGATATYQGGEHNIEVLADAAVGATTVSVGNVQFPLADDTELTGDYTRTNDGKLIPLGTHVSRTSAGLLIPRRNFDAALDDVKVAEITQSDAFEFSKSAAKSGYGTYSEANCYENLMPDADPTTGDLPTDFKTELVAGGFKFSDYVDSRVP